MKQMLVTGLFFLFLSGVAGQSLSWKYNNPYPQNARNNAGNLFAGIGLNILGVAGMAGTVYYYAEYNQEDEYLLPVGTFTASLGLAVTGTAMVIKSISNMVRARPDRKKMKNSKSFAPDLSITVEPTRYGIGIICRF